MGMPSFLIIGAAKAGTTALHEALEQHPQICMSPIKEPNFFALEGSKLEYAKGSVQEVYLGHCITDLTTYRAQFQPSAGQIAGEASPIYLYDPKAAERIQHYIPNVKLIAILRDPIDRAYSNFLHHIRDELETCSDFLQAIEQEPQRISNYWWWGFHYVQASLYYQQLSVYFDKFSSNQIKIYLYEDLVQDHLGTIQSMFRFLEVDSTFVLNKLDKKNVTGIPKSRAFHSFLSQTNPVKDLFKPLLPEKFRKRLVNNLKNQNLAKPRLPLEVRKQLLPVFRDDIGRLQDLIQRDLSAWLQ